MNASVRRTVRGALVASAVAAASAAPAAAASAATISVDKACYVNTNPGAGAPMIVSGTGFAPGETIDVSGGTVYAQAIADGSGSFATTTKAPILSTIDPASETTTITATGETSRAVATAAVRAANLAVKTSPGSVRNVRRDKATFSFSGFTPGRHIYGYYTRGHRTVRARFGVASGPCGILTQKALLYPGGRPAHDTYTVTFESVPRLSQTAAPKITGTLSILHF